MSTLPLIRMNVVLPLVEYLLRMGSPVNRYMQQAKISPKLLEQPNAVIPVELVYRFMEIVIRQEDLPHLGLTLGQKLPLSTFGYYGQAMQDSRTVYEYLKKGISLQNLQHSSNWYWMTEHGDELRIHCRSPGHSAVGTHQADVLGLIITIQQLHHASNGLWSPTELSLAQKGEKLPAVEILANTHISMGTGESYFTLPRTLLEQPFAPSDKQQPSITARKVNTLPTDLPAAIRVVMETLLPVTDPDIELVAEAVGVSVRTLERKLAQQHLTYSRILADARTHLAAEWLNDDHVSIKYIAYTLGYRDPSNFSRAFRRNTGISPQKYRQQAELHKYN